MNAIVFLRRLGQTLAVGSSVLAFMSMGPLAASDSLAGDLDPWNAPSPVVVGTGVAPFVDGTDVAEPPQESLDLWDVSATQPESSPSDRGTAVYRPSRRNVSDTWVSADMLVWWTKGAKTPALVTTSPDGTARGLAGVLGQPGTSVLHGGSGLDDNYRPGVRVTLGHWLDDPHMLGVEMTWFSLGDGANSGNFYAQSVGTPLSPILSRPFFDVNLGAQNAQLVAFPNVVEGDIQVTTSSEMHSISALLRRNFALSSDCRMDLIGGYRYFRFLEGMTIQERLNSVDPGGAVAVGTTFDLVDRFAAENDFHGGEIGLSTQIDHGTWVLDAVTKVAFGNMHQVVRISGATTVVAPGGGPVMGNGGLLALPSNIGTSSQDVFAFIPELNVNLRYQYSDQLSFVLGYNLLWVTNVARSGDQIDTNINPTQLPIGGGALAGPALPAASVRGTTMWAQGLNFGALLEF